MQKYDINNNYIIILIKFNYNEFIMDVYWLYSTGCWR